MTEDKERFLDLVTEALIPGRSAEVRRPTKAELAATLVLALPLEDWSLKISAGWPEDEDDDVAGTGLGGRRPRPRGVRRAAGGPGPPRGHRGAAVGAGAGRLT